MTALLCARCLIDGSAALLRAVLAARPGGHGGPETRLTVAGLTAHAARLTGQSTADIASRRRFVALVRTRKAIVRVATWATPVSTPTIAKALGGRDHSTVINLRNGADVLIERDPEFAWFVERLWAAAEGEPMGPSWRDAALTAPPSAEESDEAAEAEPATPKVITRCEPGEYVPRHALPPVLAVVDASLAEPSEVLVDGATAFLCGVAGGTGRLLAALRREHPERFTRGRDLPVQSAGWAA